MNGETSIVIESKSERTARDAGIVRAFRESGFLISPGVLEELRQKTSEELASIIEKLKTNYGGANAGITTVTETDIKEATHEIKIPSFVEVKRSGDFKPLAKEYGHDLRFHPENDITGKSKCMGGLDDFVRYFNDRLKKTKEVFMSRPSQNRIVNIEALANLHPGESARVIGIVSRKSPTKKGHYTIDLEDETGMVMVLVLNDAKNKACIEKTQKVILDEVIAVDVKVSTNFKIVNDIIWPDIQVKHKKTIEKDLSIAFVSDTHVGSKNFCGAELERMIRWLHGAGPGKEIAEKIGYLLIAGDVVDGIGIYPKQERDLVIKDIYEQYKLFSKLIEMVPDHIEIVVIPGNHDAVRIAEPQPAIPNDMIPSDGRIHSIGNPAYVDIEGLRTLMYHGGSIESVIAAVPDMNFTHPDLAAVELLKRRTLDPLYDKNDIAPEHTDYLFIDEVDIFQTGHIHRNAYTEYRGTIVLNSGAWMSQTEYQMKRGIVPTPAILPVYNMKSGRMIHVDFYGQDIKVV